MNLLYNKKYFLIVIFFVCTVFYGNTQIQKIPVLASHLIDETAPSSCFGYYNATPESPDGKKLVFLRFYKVPEVNWGNAAALWLLDLETGEKRKLVDINGANIHDGAMMCWIDKKHIVYQDGPLSSINVDDYDELRKRDDDNVSIINIETLKKRTFKVRGRLGHHPHEGKVLITSMHDINGRWGLYEVDTSTGKDRFICDATSFEPLIDKSIREGRDAKYWKFLHAFYSPDGKKVAFRMTIRGYKEYVPGGGNQNQMGIINIDGTNPMMFGLIPLHFGWFDNDVIFGFAGRKGYAVTANDPHMKGCSDSEGGMYLFNIGNKNTPPYCLEKISAPGNHSAISPCKQWYASENMYGEDSIELRLYKKYEDIPLSIVTKNPFGARTWSSPGPVHINPSFSRDGKRLYFVEVTDGRRFQAKWADISTVKK